MESSTPRVSIGLAVFNGERYLEQAVRSILAQDFEEFELILSDNGSSDRTPQIIQELAAADDRLRAHLHPQNRGAAWNYNFVFARARGGYFKWTAHDDVYEPTFVSRCVAVLDDRPEVSLAYTNAVDIDENGDVIETYPSRRYADQATVTERMASFFSFSSPCLETFGVMRREQLAGTKLIGAYTSSDRTLMLEMALQGRFHEIPEPLLLHRQHPERSMKRYADPRERAAWFDPRLAGSFSFPAWRLLREYADSIARSDLQPRQKAICLGHLGRWSARSSPRLARDLAVYGRHLLARLTAAGPDDSKPGPA